MRSRRFRGGDVACHDGEVEIPFTQRSYRLQDARTVAMGGIYNQEIHARLNQGFSSAQRFLSHAYSRPYPQPSQRIFAGVGDTCACVKCLCK